MTSLGNSGQLLTTKLHTLFHLLVLPLKRKDIAAPPRTSSHKEEIATLPVYFLRSYYLDHILLLLRTYMSL